MNQRDQIAKLIASSTDHILTPAEFEDVITMLWRLVHVHK